MPWIHDIQFTCENTARISLFHVHNAWKFSQAENQSAKHDLLLTCEIDKTISYGVKYWRLSVEKFIIVV